MRELRLALAILAAFTMEPTGCEPSPLGPLEEPSGE